MNQVTKEFIRLLNEERDFYECHEIFEAAWKGADDPVQRSFYKALVQVATAQFKLKKGMLRGVRKLYDYAAPSLNALPNAVEGIDILRLREDFSTLVCALPDKDYIAEDEYKRYGLSVMTIYLADLE